MSPEPKSPGLVNITYLVGDAESGTFALQFVEVFDAAKWKCGLMACTFGTVLFGIRAPELTDEGAEASRAIRAALAAAGIGFGDRSVPKWGTSTGSHFPSGAAQLYVGPKALPWAAANPESTA